MILTREEIIPILQGKSEYDYSYNINIMKLYQTASKINRTKYLKQVFKAQVESILWNNRFLDANNYIDIELIKKQNDSPIPTLDFQKRYATLFFRHNVYSRTFNLIQALLALINFGVEITAHKGEICTYVMPQISLDFYKEQVKLYRAFKPMKVIEVL
jgi:hypothetical protein